MAKRFKRTNLKDWKLFCWRCGWYSNEWLSLRIFIERRGKCFRCRIDALDKKYGPSEFSKLWREVREELIQPYPTKWEIKLKKLRRMYE